MRDRISKGKINPQEDMNDEWSRFQMIRSRSFGGGEGEHVAPAVRMIIPRR